MSQFLDVVRWAWTIISAVGLAASLYCLVDTTRDLRAISARVLPQANGIALVGRTERRRHINGALILTDFVVVGAGSLYFASGYHPGDVNPTWWRVLAILLLIKAALIVVIDRAADIAARRKLRRLTPLPELLEVDGAPQTRQ